MGKSNKISFEYDLELVDDSRLTVEVEASIYLGTTPAMGPDPDQIDIVSVKQLDGWDVETDEIPDYEWDAMEQKAFEKS